MLPRVDAAVAPTSAGSFPWGATAGEWVSSANRGGPLRSCFLLHRDDCPVYMFQLPAKIDKHEIDFNWGEHLAPFLEGLNYMSAAFTIDRTRFNRRGLRRMDIFNAAKKLEFFLTQKINYLSENMPIRISGQAKV